jgi:hypothetical protein
VTPRFVVSVRDDAGGKRVFFTDQHGRGLWEELPSGDRQIEGTSDAGPFRSEAALRRFVVKRFAIDEAGPGRPAEPGALRRTGRPLHVLLPPDEHEAAHADAKARGMSAAEHVRDLLAAWRKRHRAA